MEPVICALCNEPIEPGDKTDEGTYGVCHHECQDFGVVGDGGGEEEGGDE